MLTPTPTICIYESQADLQTLICLLLTMAAYAADRSAVSTPSFFPSPSTLHVDKFALSGDLKRRRALMVLTSSEVNANAGSSNPLSTQLRSISAPTVQMRNHAEGGSRKAHKKLRFDVSEKEIVEHVNFGLRNGHFPDPTHDGTGGSYLLKDAIGKPHAVWKPALEEPYAPRNPRGYILAEGANSIPFSPMRPGFRVGRGFLRERAAYALDASSGKFAAGVPLTTIAAEVSSSDGKGTAFVELQASSSSIFGSLGDFSSIGSVQKFVPNMGDCEDYGSGVLDTGDVQRLAVLDIRLLNADRHGSNILIARDEGSPTSARPCGAKKKLVPIDHGFCLPCYTKLGGTSFAWSSWPQVREPLSAGLSTFVEKGIDIAADVQLLRENGIDNEACLLSMRMSTHLLKVGVAAGLTLAQISQLLQREDPETGDTASSQSASAFEKLVSNAAAAAQCRNNKGCAARVHHCTFGSACTEPQRCGCESCQIFLEFASRVEAIIPNSKQQE